MSKKATKGTLHICVLIRHVGVAKRITDVATEEYSLNVLLIVNIQQQGKKLQILSEVMHLIQDCLQLYVKKWDQIMYIYCCTPEYAGSEERFLADCMS